MTTTEIKSVTVGRVEFSVQIDARSVYICVRRGRDGSYEAVHYDRRRGNVHRGYYETASAYDMGPSGDVDSCLVAPSPIHFGPTQTHQYRPCDRLSSVIESYARELLAEPTVLHARELLGALFASASCRYFRSAADRARTLIAVDDDLTL